MAGIDTSIYQNLLRPPKTVAEYDAEAQAAEQNKLTLQMGRMKTDEYTRGLADQNKLRSVVAGFGADAKANYNALLGAGRLTEAQKYAKENSELAKTAADTKHTEAQTAETHVKAANLKMGQARDMFNTITTPEQAAQLVRGMYADPDLGKLFAMKGDTAEAAVSRIPTDPAAFAQWVQAASLNAEKLATYRTPDANTVASNAQSNANSLRSAASAKYSADSSAASAAAGRKQADRHFGVTEQRHIEELKLKKAAEKAPTEFQGKSAAFGARAEEADKTISGLAGKYSPVAVNGKNAAEQTWLVGGALGAAVNKFGLNESDQKADQAQRDFINAVLRQESGAAIGASEFDNARKQYFPQPGDAAGVIAQKSKNRKLAVDGLKRNAGKAAFSAPADADVFSAADAILNGGK